jgi:nitric oxide reductase NorD protein
MEEWVGSLWDRWITRAAATGFPAASVSLPQVEKTAGILFRAFGGDPGVRVGPAIVRRHEARRRWLARIAGTGERTALATLDRERLSLPPRIELFADPDLNRDLYLWLAALAAHDVPIDDVSGHGLSREDCWVVRNQRATAVTLARFPGLGGRYRRLVAACLELRIPPAHLPAAEAAVESALRAALERPGSIAALPRPAGRGRDAPQMRACQPVPLWLHDATSAGQSARQAQHQAPAAEAQQGDGARHAAEQVEMPTDRNGVLLMFRAESLLSWAEYVKVNRPQDDDPDPAAASAAQNMDKLSLAQDGERIASRIRFDLDLPSAAEDDLPLGPGLLLPEWDYRQGVLKPGFCCLQTMTARTAVPLALPPQLRATARRLRQRFEMLAPERRWRKAQPEGSEPDLDAWVRRHADRQAGASTDEGMYLAQVRQSRDLACLVLADLSLSTDAWASGEQRVIDVIRDALMLFAEALSGVGDRFALYGFSSLKRGHVRFNELKTFEQAYDAPARGRIAAIRPGYYTRLGAAIRQGTRLLQRQPSRQRLLLLLSDGKPHDIDLYEGRYGIEDTRISLRAASEQGVRPFCITIDKEAADYLPHMFGNHGYTLLRRPEHLPERLPLIYSQLTRH